jgi:DNA polymerase-3 subunit delta
MGSTLHPVYIFYGPETGQRLEAIDSVRKGLADVHGEGLEEHKYFAGDDAAGDIISDLSNGALFASHTLAIVQNAEAISRKSDISAYADFLRNENPDVTMIFTSSETRLDKALVKLAPESARKIFWELFENQKESWVVNYLRGRNARISPEGLDLFLSLVENNTQEMAQELDKMLLMAPEGQDSFVIDEELVENYIYHSKEESVYSLFAAYADRDFPGALEILQKLRGAKSGDETAIIIRMGYQLRQLASLSAIRDQRPVQAADYTALRLFGKTIQGRYARLLSVLDTATIRRHVSSAAEFEMQLRQARGAMHGHIIQLWLYSLFFPLRGSLAGRRDTRMFSVTPNRFS